jgi:FixJ family two-component response regulator
MDLSNILIVAAIIGLLANAIKVWEFGSTRVRAYLQWDTLTPGEREVIEELAKGRTNRQIAKILGVSRLTVRFRIACVMRKVNARSLRGPIRAPWDDSGSTDMGSRGRR